jgi:hypothetical protein
MALTTSPDEDEIALKQAYMKYLSQMPEYEKTYTGEDIAKDVGKEKGFVNKLGAGISGAMKYLGTGQGQQIISGLIKNPTARVNMWHLGNREQQEERANQSAYANAMNEKMKEIGSTVREQEKTKQMLEALKYSKGEERESETQKATRIEKETGRKEQVDASQKLADKYVKLITPDEYKTLVDPKNAGKYTVKESWGLLGRKYKVVPVEGKPALNKNVSEMNR